MLISFRYLVLYYPRGPQTIVDLRFFYSEIFIPSVWCLRRIRRIFWPEKIRNEDLLKSCNMEPISACVRRRRLRWLGHVLRLPNNSLARVALRWTPQGKRKRGRPKITWRRSVEAELRDTGLTWETASKQAKDRLKWRSLVEAPCAT